MEGAELPDPRAASLALTGWAELSAVCPDAGWGRRARHGSSDPAPGRVASGRGQDPGGGGAPPASPFARRCLVGAPQIAVCLGGGGVSTRSGAAPGTGPGPPHARPALGDVRAVGPASACQVTWSAQSGGRAPGSVPVPHTCAGVQMWGEGSWSSSGASHSKWPPWPGRLGPGLPCSEKPARKPNRGVRPVPCGRLCRESHSKMEQGTSAARLSHATHGSWGWCCRLRGGLHRLLGSLPGWL